MDPQYPGTRSFDDNNLEHTERPHGFSQSGNMPSLASRDASTHGPNQSHSHWRPSGLIYGISGPGLFPAQSALTSAYLADPRMQQYSASSMSNSCNHPEVQANPSAFQYDMVRPQFFTTSMSPALESQNFVPVAAPASYESGNPMEASQQSHTQSSTVRSTSGSWFSFSWRNIPFFSSSKGKRKCWRCRNAKKKVSSAKYLNSSLTQHPD